VWQEHKLTVMAPIAGTYRFLSSDNLLKECEVTYADFLSTADIKLLAAADNEWVMDIKETEKGVIIKTSFRYVRRNI